MKKVLLLAAVAFGFSSAAQTIPYKSGLKSVIEKSKVENVVKPNFSKKSSNKGGALSAYYSYADTATAFLTDLDYYNLSISPDSTTTQVYSDGSTGSHYFHGAGAIYDMTFYGWQNNRFADQDLVTLDSIFVVGYYDILNSGQTDTLRFHVFHNDITSANSGFSGVNWNAGVFSYFPTAQVPQSTMDYSGSSDQGYVGGPTASGVTTIDYILGTSDSANFVHGVAVPGGMTFDGDEAVGIYVEYIPGNYGFNDTINPSSGTGTTNRFGVLCAGEPDFSNSRGDFIAFYDSTYMNNSNFVINENRYGMFSGGGAFLNDMTYPWSDLANFIMIHASGTSTIGFEDAELTSVSIFPNPSNGVVNVELDATTDATVTVVDVLGQVVYASNENFVAGERKVIDLSNNAKGMYILSVEGEGVNTVERITIK